MHTKDIQRFVTRYFEATQSEILEKSPYHIKVKLSPQADKELTNRPFYWSFVERSNEKPETLSFCFVFDPEKYEQLAQKEQTKKSEEEQLGDSLIARTIGYVAPPSFNKIQTEHMHYGSQRLEQIFSSTKQNGGYVCLFQEPAGSSRHPLASMPYTVWLGINYRVEFCCDRKREEIHSLGISLVTGFVQEQFYSRLEQIRLTPRIPPNVHIAKNGISYNKAVQTAEQHIERKLKGYDYKWAEAANIRLQEELERMRSYYEPMLQQAESEGKEHIKNLYAKREDEIRWQYEPRITVSVINCGLFHLSGID